MPAVGQLQPWQLHMQQLRVRQRERLVRRKWADALMRSRDEGQQCSLQRIESGW